MTEREYALLSEIFEQIRELPEGDRAPALDVACRGNPQLRAHVLRMLEADRDAADEQFLERTVLEDAADLVDGDDSQLPAAGTMLGKYRLGERVGAGGMGVIYQAEDLQLDRRVAIKILAPGLLAYLQERNHRFQREARAAAQLSHPHIAAVYDAGTGQGWSWIAMEYVEGRTLRSIIADKTTLPDCHSALDIIAQAASALSAAHEAGIVHRDIKPENIMLRRDGFVKVLDFGLATVREQENRPRQLTGTVQYFSPEQARGDGADARSDLFSLGVVAYELATGLRPFDAPSDAAVLDAILHRQPAPPSKLRPELGPRFDDFVSRALEKNPELRFQSAAEMREACRESTQAPSTAARGATVNRAALIGFICLFIAALTLWWTLRPGIRPQVKQVVQITAGDQPVTHFVASGGDIYYAAGPADDSTGMFEVSASGGEPVPMPQLRGMFPLDISPDGSLMLLGKFSGGARVGPFPLWTALLPSMTLRPLGIVGQFARWSPKGDQFAYSEGRSLKVSRSDGSHPRTVAQISGYIEDAAWSPDGTRLRFTVSLTNSRRIWEVGLDGAGLRPLFADWTEPFTEVGSWTRDGKYFIFSAGHTAHDLWVRRERRLLSLERDSAPVPLTTGPFWALQPQPVAGGQKVYFVGTSNIGQLVRLDTRSGQWLAFLDGIDAAQVDYSADGKWITYADSNGCLWRSAADGSHRVRLTSPPFFARNPRWSPDGNRILYYGAPMGQNDVIYVMPSSGGAITRLTPRDTKTSEGDATWSPDGMGIIYGSISGEADRKPYLYRMDLRTGRIEELPGTARLWSPRWSPDGMYVAALDQASNLTLYSIVTHEAATLTSFAAGYPTWSRDSHYIYFENNSSSAWYRVGIGERRVELLRRLNGLRTAFSSAGWLGMTPDGTPISSRAASSSNVYALEWQDR